MISYDVDSDDDDVDNNDNDYDGEGITSFFMMVKKIIILT